MDPDVPFPRLERYLRRLPNGIDSYPDCRCRASVYRVFTDTLDLTSFPFDDVPPPIRAMLNSPLLPGSWLHETHVIGAILAAIDFRRLDDDAALRWMDESNERLLNGRMFRSLMRLASPSILVALASRQWGHIHRGMRFVVERGMPTKVRIEYPAHLYDELLARATASGIRHALTLSRAKDPRVEMESHSPTTAIYRVTWS
ncbi:MAG: hypothetical protein K0S65_5680 [Labilithrix sp.]|nr:hypothetical protein [Labilithrix sp.]